MAPVTGDTMPRVSILLTCFNHLEFLPACVQGIRSQTFADFEVIALDDGSTDGTREWLSENAADWQLVFNEQNLGTYATLNVGLARARGEYVAILNDDDLWAPEKLARQVAMLDSSPEVGLVHTDGAFIDGKGNPMEGSPLGFEFPRTDTGDVLIPLLYANKIIASAVLVRRKCFDELGGFNEKYFGSGDWEMWLRVAERHLVGFVPEKLTFYRVHGSNASHKLDRIWRDDQMLREWIVERSGSYDPDKYGPANLTAALAHNWACLGTVRKLNGDAAGARSAFASSMRLMPSRLKNYARYVLTFAPTSWVRRLL